MRFVSLCILALLEWQVCFTNATVCLCVEVLKSTEVYSQPDLRSNILGYLDNGECFHGYYTEGNDWVTVIDGATEIHIGRGSLFPCDPKTFLNEDIQARLRRPQKNEMVGNHFLRSVELKRFLLDTQSLNRAQCNFDLGSLCSWRNVHGQDDFDWVLYQSSTPTDDTGPDFDHTLRNATGKYVFIESSAPRSLFDAAWLQSPIIEATGQLVHCFRFWYHMYGKSIGRLDVYQASSTFVPGNLMWTVIGDHGNAWLQGQVALESAQNYSIIIAGFVGDGYQGDIAIDDISLSDGYCDVEPPSASRSEVSNSTWARVDGAWNAWTPWTTCDVTCVGGTQTRTRECYFPPRVTHGNGCPESASESRTCHSEQCPDSGLATDATTTSGLARTTTMDPSQTPVSFCSALASIPCSGLNVVCGSNGQYYPNQCELYKARCPDLRLRIVDLSNCAHSGTEVDAAWLAWLPWTACYVTCNGGTQIRTRECHFPPGVKHGHGCYTLYNGSAYELRPCLSEQCPDSGLATDATTTSGPSRTTTMNPTPTQNVICSAFLSISCSDEVEPRCGSDGKFYLNICELLKAKWCHDTTLKMMPWNSCHVKRLIEESSLSDM